MAEAIVLREGEGKPLEARGSLMVFKAIAATTGGAFSFMERRLPPGGRPPPRHIHLAAAEAFYVVEGRITFWLDEEIVDCAGGDFVLAPGGVAHSFANRGDADARVLILHSPAMDSYFEELHDMWSGAEPPSRAAERDLMRRHGMEPVA